MTVTIDIGVAYLPEYILTEAEFLAQRICYLLPGPDNLCLTIGRRDFMYIAEFELDLSDGHYSSNATSRYPDDAIECSFWRLLAFARPFVPRPGGSNNISKSSHPTSAFQSNRIYLK